MRKMIWLTVVVVLFAVFLLPGLLSLGIKYIPYDFQPSLEGVRGIYGLLTVSQEFTSQKEQLTGIGMTVKNPNLKNKKEFYLDLFNDKGEHLRRVVYNGANVEDGSYIKFIFDPIPDSMGKNYKFLLSNPSAGEEEVLGVYYTPSKPGWMGKLLFNEEEAEGGLSIVTYHMPGGRLSVIKGIYSNLLSRLLNRY